MARDSSLGGDRKSYEVYAENHADFKAHVKQFFDGCVGSKTTLFWHIFEWGSLKESYSVGTLGFNQEGFLQICQAFIDLFKDHRSPNEANKTRAKNSAVYQELKNAFHQHVKNSNYNISALYNKLDYLAEEAFPLYDVDVAFAEVLNTIDREQIAHIINRADYEKESAYKYIGGTNFSNEQKYFFHVLRDLICDLNHPLKKERAERSLLLNTLKKDDRFQLLLSKNSSIRLKPLVSPDFFPLPDYNVLRAPPSFSPMDYNDVHNLTVVQDLSLIHVIFERFVKDLYMLDQREIKDLLAVLKESGTSQINPNLDGVAKQLTECVVEYKNKNKTETNLILGVGGTKVFFVQQKILPTLHDMLEQLAVVDDAQVDMCDVFYGQYSSVFPLSRTHTTGVSAPLNSKTPIKTFSSTDGWKKSDGEKKMNNLKSNLETYCKDLGIKKDILSKMEVHRPVNIDNLQRKLVFITKEKTLEIEVSRDLLSPFLAATRPDKQRMEAFKTGMSRVMWTAIADGTRKIMKDKLQQYENNFSPEVRQLIKQSKLVVHSDEAQSNLELLFKFQGKYVRVVMPCEALKNFTKIGVPSKDDLKKLNDAIQSSIPEFLYNNNTISSSGRGK